jgi:hypothetical protein
MKRMLKKPCRMVIKDLLNVSKNYQKIYFCDPDDLFGVYSVVMRQVLVVLEYVRYI